MKNTLIKKAIITLSCTATIASSAMNCLIASATCSNSSWSTSQYTGVWSGPYYSQKEDDSSVYIYNTSSVQARVVSLKGVLTYNGNSKPEKSNVEIPATYDMDKNKIGSVQHYCTDLYVPARSERVIYQYIGENTDNVVSDKRVWNSSPKAWAKLMIATDKHGYKASGVWSADTSGYGFTPIN